MNHDNLTELKNDLEQCEQVIEHREREIAKQNRRIAAQLILALLVLLLALTIYTWFEVPSVLALVPGALIISCMFGVQAAIYRRRREVLYQQLNEKLRQSLLNDIDRQRRRETRRNTQEAKEIYRHAKKMI